MTVVLGLTRPPRSPQHVLEPRWLVPQEVALRAASTDSKSSVTTIINFHHLKLHLAISIPPESIFPSSGIPSLSIDTEAPPPTTHPGDRQTAAMPGLTSAAGLIGLLDEPDQQLRCYALKQLDNYVHQFWPEIADEVSKMYVVAARFRCLVMVPLHHCRRHWLPLSDQQTPSPSTLMKSPPLLERGDLAN